MDPITRQKSEKLIEGRNIVKKAARANFSQMHLLGGMLYMNSEQPINEEKVKECRALLKQKTSLLSNIRGIVEIAVVVKMASQPKPQEYIDRVLQAYDVLTAGKMFRSEYLVLTAMVIADYVEPQAYDRIASATWALYGQMRAEHPLITNQNDTTFAALLVIHGQNSDAIMEEMERCYHIISKKGFALAKDTAQAVSQVLALCSRPTEEKCARFMRLRDMLKAKGCKLHKGPAQAIIAAFNDVNVPDEQLVTEIVEVDSWLKKQKGMGALGAGSQLRRVMACVIVLEAHKSDKASVASAASSALASSIATQIVMIIILVVVIVTISAANSAAASAQ